MIETVGLARMRIGRYLNVHRSLSEERGSQISKLVMIAAGHFILKVGLCEPLEKTR